MSSDTKSQKELNTLLTCLAARVETARSLADEALGGIKGEGGGVTIASARDIARGAALDAAMIIASANYSSGVVAEMAARGIVTRIINHLALFGQRRFTSPGQIFMDGEFNLKEEIRHNRWNLLAVAEDAPRTKKLLGELLDKDKYTEVCNLLSMEEGRALAGAGQVWVKKDRGRN